MKKSISTAVMVAAMAHCGQLWAAEPVAVLDEVVVSATKTEEQRRDVVNSVIVLDSMHIEESTASDFGDLLANEPGIDWRTYGNYGGASGSIEMRGMGSEETQILVNGVALNSPSLGSADVSGIELNNIERIEVVKGSGSLLYGSGAMAGTINIITKSPERDNPVFKVSSGYGTDDTYELSAEQGMFVSDSFGYYLTANHRGTDGERDNSKLNQNDGSLRLLLDRGKDLKVSLYGQYLDRDFGLPSIDPPDGAAAVNSSYPFYNGESASTVNHGADRDGHVVFEVDSAPVSWLGINVQADLVDMQSYSYQRYNYNGTGFKSWVDNEVLGVEANLDVKPADNLSVLLGSDYSDHDWGTKTVNLDNTGAETTTTTNNAKINAKGSYMEAQFRPLETFKAVAGMRHEAHSTFGNINLPHYGVILSPDKQTNIKLNNGKHFKAPTPNDLFWPETAFVKGNPDLAPQHGWHTDATIERTMLDDKLFISGSYFHWDIKGKITWAYDSGIGKWTPTNLNSSEGRGWELGIRYSPMPSLDLGFSYTYTDAMDKIPAGERKAQNQAANRAKVSVVYRWDNGLTASTTIRYTDDRQFYRSSSSLAASDILDSYVTTDLKLEQQVRDNLRLSLMVNNLFDVAYDTYVSSFKDSAATSVWGSYPGAGMSVFMKVAYEF